ncbi:hypothetical protein GCM10010252_72750 [Streptomyces aureoverticillatus]|nr:hypothetical protein GCM10010252_72750 [Streptomyces aureoverticillatus]
MVGIAETTKVRHDDGVLWRKPRDEVPPVIAGLGHTMQQYHRGAGPGRSVMQFRPVDGDAARTHGFTTMVENHCSTHSSSALYSADACERRHTRLLTHRR